MIDKEKVARIIDVLDKLEDIDENYTSLGIDRKGMTLKVYTKDWWRGGQHWSAEKRHANLALLTPLVGKLEKKESNGNINYDGQKDDLVVQVNYVEVCKIVGYKTITRTVQKEVEIEPKYETVEEEQRVAITDCDIKQGRYKESEIEERV